MFTYDGTKSAKSQRVARLRDAPLEQAPRSYTSDSEKEVFCKEFVRVFIAKFSGLFPKRRKPVLLPENEYGVPKLICTFLRASMLPYRGLYDVQSIAKFVSNYLRYEPLHPTDDFPAVIPSPTQVQY